MITFPVIVNGTAYGAPRSQAEADELSAKVATLLTGLNDLNLAVALCCRAQLECLEAIALAEDGPGTHCSLCGFPFDGTATLTNDPEDGGLCWACTDCMTPPAAYAEQEAAAADEADAWYDQRDADADRATWQRETHAAALAPARAIAATGPSSMDRRGARLTLGDGSVWEEHDGDISLVAPPDAYRHVQRTAPHWLLVLIVLILGLLPIVACTGLDHAGMNPQEACAADPTCHGRP